MHEWRPEMANCVTVAWIGKLGIIFLWTILPFSLAVVGLPLQYFLILYFFFLSLKQLWVGTKSSYEYYCCYLYPGISRSKWGIDRLQVHKQTWLHLVPVTMIPAQNSSVRGGVATNSCLVPFVCCVCLHGAIFSRSSMLSGAEFPQRHFAADRWRPFPTSRPSHWLTSLSHFLPLIRCFLVH